MNNAVFVSGVQQSDSVTHIHVRIHLFLFKFSSHLGYYGILSKPLPLGGEYVDLFEA